MKKYSFIFILFFGLALMGCVEEADFITLGTANKLNITATMFGEGNKTDTGETRVSLYEKNGTLQFEAKWDKDDKVYFYFRQGGVIYDGGKIELTELSHNGKQASFGLHIPHGVDNKSKFDLYGFSGLDTKIKDGELYVAIHSMMCNYLDQIVAPVWSETKDISSSDVPISINFNHLGSYELVHLQNSSPTELKINTCELTPAGDTDYWYFRSELTSEGYEGYYFLPIDRTAIKVREQSSAAPAKTFKTIPAGSTAIIANWYLPNSNNFPETLLKIVTSSSVILSTNKKLGRNSTFQPKKAYHLYADWDGSQLKITDEDFNDDDDDTDDIEFGSFRDSRDGNVYKTVKIGNQVWMAENLIYLPEVNEPRSGSHTESYYYVYGYNGADIEAAKATENYKTYGVLYNWSAAMQGAASSNSNPSNVQGICPDGWHLPSNEEWKQLREYLGGYKVAGGKMKHIDHWRSPNTGATNESGFSALPGGDRYNGGYFSEITRSVNYWSSTESNIINDAYIWILNYDNSELSNGYYFGSDSGYYVRCVRD